MQKEKNRLSRRDFLKKAGAAAVAVGVASGLGVQGVLAKSPEKSNRGRRSVNTDYDVIVVGGGPAGCPAAIAAAREGSRTLLIEATGMLGGMSTAGNMNNWCPFTDGEKVIYKGLAEKIMHESKKGVPTFPEKSFDWMPINTEQLKRVFDEMVSAQGVDVLFFSRLAEVEMADNGEVDYITVANKEGLARFKAKVYIDCTGDGDLATWAGADYFFGDQESAVQESTLCFTIAGVNHEEYTRIGGRLHNNEPTSPIHKIVASGKYPLVDSHFNVKMIHPGVLIFNAGHIPGVNATDPVSLSRGMMEGRRLVEQLHGALRTESPELFANSFLASTGSLLGIRESRRIKCDYVFTIEDWVERRSFDDEIGRNCYYIDLHKQSVQKYPRYKKGESHGIPFRTLVPQKLTNVLIAGRSISSDDYAYGSLRIMPVCMVTGEAAGIAASMASSMGKIDVHGIDIPLLQKRLREEGQNI